MFERLVTEVKFVGRRERDVAWDISRIFHEEGAEAMSFESIVGSGATSSHPHARAGDKVIETGELRRHRHGLQRRRLHVRLHARFDTGDLAEEMQEAYAVVLRGGRRASTRSARA